MNCFKTIRCPCGPRFGYIMPDQKPKDDERKNFDIREFLLSQPTPEWTKNLSYPGKTKVEPNYLKFNENEQNLPINSTKQNYISNNTHAGLSDFKEPITKPWNEKYQVSNFSFLEDDPEREKRSRKMTKLERQCQLVCTNDITTENTKNLDENDFQLIIDKLKQLREHIFDMEQIFEHYKKIAANDMKRTKIDSAKLSQSRLASEWKTQYGIINPPDSRAETSLNVCSRKINHQTTELGDDRKSVQPPKQIGITKGFLKETNGSKNAIQIADANISEDQPETQYNAKVMCPCASKTAKSTDFPKTEENNTLKFGSRPYKENENLEDSNAQRVVIKIQTQPEKSTTRPCSCGCHLN